MTDGVREKDLTGSMTPEPSRPPYCRLYDDTLAYRLAMLAYTSLQRGEADKAGRCAVIWTQKLPQLCHSNPEILSALTALGAALETTVSTLQDIGARPLAMRKYDRALRDIQTQIGKPSASIDAILLACVLLACTEIIQCREVNALTHVRGAMRLIYHREKHRKSYTTRNRCANGDAVNSTPPEGDEFLPMDELDLLFVELDIQTASYALDLQPQLPLINTAYASEIWSDTGQYSNLYLETMREIHACYRLAPLVAAYKYLPTGSSPSGIVFEQARYVAALTARVKSLTLDIAKCIDSGLARQTTKLYFRQLLVLRAHCLASLIYLSMTSNSYECGYDVYAAQFQQIVHDAQTVLGTASATTAAVEQFSVSLGILQPIFLTAVKYRDPVWRRRAIELLRRGGREGPFHGKLLAAIASRAVEVEESRGATNTHSVTVAADVKEKSRLHGIGMAPNDEWQSNATLASFTLSLCKDVEAMLYSGKPWDHDTNWHIWQEAIQA